MIPRIKHIMPIDDYLLQVKFDDWKEVIYDVKKDIEQIPCFSELLNDTKLFDQVQLDQSRTCVFWTDEIDLLSDAIYEYGIEEYNETIRYKCFNKEATRAVYQRSIQVQSRL